MTDVADGQPGEGERMASKSTAQTIVLGAIAFLLIAVLSVLIVIAWRGVRVEHTGEVTLGAVAEGVELRMVDPVTLEIPEPAHLVATGTSGDAIPVDLAFPTCPDCGGAMVPARWNLWTGEIDWRCPVCTAGDD